MIDRQLKGLTASKLRMMLIASILLMLMICAGLFWLFRERLVAFAVDVQTSSLAASSSSSDIQKLRTLQKILDEDSVAVKRAKSIVADSKSYQYQDQIINDLTIYAKKAGVVITGFTFNSDVNAQANSATPPAAGSTAGLKTTTVSVAIQNPVKYKAIMNFIHSIEVNLTKMQLTGITLAKASDGDADSAVSVTPLSIEVYTR